VDQKYSSPKPKHALLRSEFLASCLIDPSLSEAHHKVIKHLVSMEALRDTYNRIWAIRNKSAGHSILAVEFTTSAGTVLATSQPAVEAALTSSLQAHFTCTCGSPFLKPSLASLVSAFGTGQAAQAILNGTFICLPLVKEPTHRFIEALQFLSDKAHQFRSLWSCILRISFNIGNTQKNKPPHQDCILDTTNLPLPPPMLACLHGCLLYSINLYDWPLYILLPSGLASDPREKGRKHPCGQSACNPTHGRPLQHCYENPYQSMHGQKFPVSPTHSTW